MGLQEDKRQRVVLHHADGEAREEAIEEAVFGFPLVSRLTRAKETPLGSRRIRNKDRDTQRDSRM